MTKPQFTPEQKRIWRQKVGSKFIKVRQSGAKVPWGKRKITRKRGKFSVRVLRSLAGRALFVPLKKAA